MMLKSSSYKQPKDIISRSYDIQPSQTQTFNNSQIHKPFQQNTKISQPELQSEQLFFQASLQFIRKKKIDNYFLFNDDLIGQGSFAKVYKGMNILTNEIVAIKVMQIKHIMENKLYGLVEAEMEIIKSLKHPNILQCYDILITDNNCYIVTQYCEDGEFKQYIKKQLKNNKTYVQDNSVLNLITLQPLIYDIYQGLLYLERKNIIHRDIKMSNILVKNGKAKIADFGLAAFSKNEGQIFIDAKVGSPIYMSPQALLDSIYGPKTDVWAFGILLFEFFHGKTPFQHCRNTKQLERQISKSFDESKITADISENAKTLLCMCLSFSWEDRPSFKELWSEEYIKSLRLKSYVLSKGLINYKETTMQSLRKQIEKNKSQKKLQKTFQTNDSQCILKTNEYMVVDNDSKVQYFKNGQKQQDDEGYSFEDFLRMNSQQEQKEKQTIGNSKSQPKINCNQININPEFSNLLQTAKVKQNQKKQNKSFEDEMQEFYRQAQNMMSQQNTISLSNQLEKIPFQVQNKLLSISKNVSNLQNKNQQKIPQNFDDAMTQIKKQKVKQKKSCYVEIISTKIQVQDNFCIDKQDTLDSDSKQFNKSLNTLSKPRKINLNKNYCQFLEQQQNNSLQKDTEVQTDKVVQKLLKENQNTNFQEISQILLNSEKSNNSQTLQFKKESIQNTCNQQQINESGKIKSDQNQVNYQQSKNISPFKVKNNPNDSIHRQNLKKFSNLLKQKSSHKTFDIKPRQNIFQKRSKNNKQSQDIDLILVILEFVRFNVKYIKFRDNISESFLQKKLYLKFEEQDQKNLNEDYRIKVFKKYHQFFHSKSKSDQICHKFYCFSQQILIKKVSEIIFTLNSQKSSQLFQIIKTHKNLLNGLKISDKTQKCNIQNYMTFFQQTFQEEVKEIQDILTIFVDQNVKNIQSQSLNLMIERLCWQALWFTKTYDTFLQLQKYLNQKNKTEQSCNQKSQDLKSIMKQLQQFVENYEKVQQNLTLQKRQQFQEQFSDKQETERIKNNINYFFQLDYEVQLRKINSINNY